MMLRFDKDYDQATVSLQKSSTEKAILADCLKHRDEQRQVLLSFTTDPYMNGFDTSLTTFTLRAMLSNRIPTAILTKAPNNAIQDFGLMQEFGESLIFGTTITTLTDHKTIEPNADTPRRRISAMAKAKEMGLITWLSMEPAFSLEEGLEIITGTLDVVDRYRLGKLNHRRSDTDWGKYVQATVELLRKHGKSVYVKSDLAKFAPAGFLTDAEQNPRLQDAKPFSS